MATSLQIWAYRAALFLLLFGVSALSYGGNSLHPLLSQVTNVMALIGMPLLIVWYFRLPDFYKFLAWALLLGVLLLILESKYEYGQYMYSYFVVKRFFFCGLALVAYCVASKAEPLKLTYVVNLIFAFFFINQILLGQIFSYNLTSESRTTTAPEALYLVIPFLYYLIRYLKEHRLPLLFLTLISFGLIVFLLHRSVISTAVIGAGFVLGLSLTGKLPLGGKGLPMSRTVATFGLMLTFTAPLIGLLPEKKVNAFLDNIGGILSPKDDNTGSWRMEQSTYYLSLVPERPLLGWRYDGYDRGEIMENEDFPEKGTIIHSQYVDMLYNYGAVGLAINLMLIGGTLLSMYQRNQTFTTEQMVLFSFITSGLVFAVSYQLPVYFWGFVGVGMYYGRKSPTAQFITPALPETPDYSYPASPVHLAKNQPSI